MKKTLFIITLLYLGCKPNPSRYAEFINGYWEIENVYKNGELLKEFKINQRIDFFKINNDLSGYRKKLKPNFDGTYTSSNDKLNFQLEIKFHIESILFILTTILLSVKKLLKRTIKVLR